MTMTDDPKTSLDSTPATRAHGRASSAARQAAAAKRDKRDVHGWVMLDKPVGMTSTHAVAVVKRLFSAKRAGHAGTLDPLASGGLPIALGEATKTVPFVMDGRKRYRFTVRWGEERDTDDSEGRVGREPTTRPTARGHPGAAAALHRHDRAGSAALFRHQGRRASAPTTWPARARSWNCAAARSRFTELILVEQPDTDHAVFEAECGKGTYVRSLARDMGRMLGCFGHV